MTATRAILADLVGFDTTSRNSNLELIGYVRRYLEGYGVEAELFPDGEGGKASLYATIGGSGSGGFILSGHTDCVPVDGQIWATDPFVLTEHDGRLYGRGTADMKGFLASALALVPHLVASRRPKPVHLAFSYDEETGCTGVRDMIHRLASRGERPAACLVGEPTGMAAVIGHKGGRAYRCNVSGSEAHSSLAPRAVNAVEIAAELIVSIRRLARQLAEGASDPEYDVVHSTISTGIVAGGTAINIVPKHCSFTFEFRNLIEVDPDTIAAGIIDHAQDVLLPAMRAIDPACTIEFCEIYSYPAHAIDPGHPLVTRVKAAVQSNGHSKVAFGTEAGLFQRDLGVPTVVCGPGHIGVAHRPDEYVEQSQLDACDRALLRIFA